MKLITSVLYDEFTSRMGRCLRCQIADCRVVRNSVYMDRQTHLQLSGSRVR